MQFDPNLIPTTLDLLHLTLAIVVAFLILLSIVLGLLWAIASTKRPSKAEPVLAAPAAPVLRAAPDDGALVFLSLLQQEARFIDFVEEDLSHHADADIGAAARVVHAGCQKMFRQHLELQPIRLEAEGSAIELPRGFDASSIRLSGQVVGEPPFKGVLVHPGWRAKSIRLPKLGERHDVKILAPAEVEL